jgi:hypothetical protein
VIIPQDYRDLLDVHGPGTLCGALRLLAPGGPDGFNLDAAHQSLFALGVERGYWEADAWDYEDAGDNEDHTAITRARLWGVFTTGETCWWLPIRDDPADWLVLVVGHGWQQLNISTADFLHRWAGGQLDLPVLPHGAVRREWQVTPASQPVTTPAPPSVARDPLAQLATIVGPGDAAPASFDWARVETQLGRSLPPDYKRLIEIFGSGDYLYEISFSWNGIYTNSPAGFYDGNDPNVANDLCILHPPPGFPSPGELLFCGSTEGRDLLAWDTRNSDPARWPVITVHGDAEIFPGTLTELYVAELTGTGPGLTSFTPGDPDTWAWPIWGPDARG